MRQFCEADGVGQRVRIEGWQTVAPLVTWTFEPAWDHVVLITGYGVGAPRAIDGGAFAVDVRYSVVGQVTALGFDAAAHVETATFQVSAPDERGWRIGGPPPPPHVFGTHADVDQMRRSLATGGVNFIADSTFVWQLFRSAGWNVAFERTEDLLTGAAYRAIDKPKVGDLVVYLRDGDPYHVGVLEAENRVVSSTLNAGVVRATIDAFAGEVKYMRLVEPEPIPTVAPTPPPAAGAAPVPVHPAPHPRVRQRPKPASKHVKKARPRRRKPPQHSARKRVKARVRTAPKRARPTPVAAPRVP